MKPTVPVVLFAYSRPDHLTRTLESLRCNEVPLIYVFSDGPKTLKQAGDVARVREILGNVDWCDIDLCLREDNLGLGRSILTGVSAVLTKHDSVIIFEDDLVCVPGTVQIHVRGFEILFGQLSRDERNGLDPPPCYPSRRDRSTIF